MVISIDFSGSQRTVTKTHRIRMPITHTTKVTDVLDYVHRQFPDLHLRKRMVIALVNHEAAPLHKVLRPNDTVAFLPPIGGA